jgi:hypothetical protein
VPCHPDCFAKKPSRQHLEELSHFKFQTDVSQLQLQLDDFLRIWRFAADLT